MKTITIKNETLTVLDGEAALFDFVTEMAELEFKHLESILNSLRPDAVRAIFLVNKDLTEARERYANKVDSLYESFKARIAEST